MTEAPAKEVNVRKVLKNIISTSLQEAQGYRKYSNLVHTKNNYFQGCAP